MCDAGLKSMGLWRRVAAGVHEGEETIDGDETSAHRGDALSWLLES